MKVRKLTSEEATTSTLGQTKTYGSDTPKKRGRPKGSKNKTTQEPKKAKSVKKVKTLKEYRKAAETEGKFKFTSDKCHCVHYSDIIGSAMFCIHQHALHGVENI